MNNTVVIDRDVALKALDLLLGEYRGAAWFLIHRDGGLRIDRARRAKAKATWPLVVKMQRALGLAPDGPNCAIVYLTDGRIYPAERIDYGIMSCASCGAPTVGGRYGRRCEAGCWSEVWK